MKKLSCLLVAVLLICQTQAQSVRSLAGNWEGLLPVRISLRLVFHFSLDSSGQWTATADSPDQDAFGIPCKNVLLTGDSLHMEIPSIGGRFRGLLLSDSTLHGQWIQGTSLDISMKKTKVPIERLRRPQTPVPPFPYSAEDVEYDNSDKSIHFGATLTTPAGNGPFPAVVLITGSGAQDRDESLLGHKPFAVIADYLSRHGLIVLRVDDRGMGKSTGNFAASTSADFAADVNTSLDFLKTRPKVNIRQLGLIGHSEGGMIAPMVAAARKDIHFIILLAGPGEKLTNLLTEQNCAILLSVGVVKDAVQSFRQYYPGFLQAILDSKSQAEAEQKLTAAVEDWKQLAQKNWILATTGIYNDSTQQKYVHALVQTLYTPWFLYFLKFDPQPWLEKLQCKVLALNGEKDLQVLPESNLKGIQESLQKSKSPSFEVHQIPGLNHLFQTCKKCTIQEYGQLEETFSTLALEMMSSWISKNVN